MLLCVIMAKNKIQVTLPDAAVKRFADQAKLQKRSLANLARKYIIEGLQKEERKEVL